MEWRRKGHKVTADDDDAEVTEEDWDVGCSTSGGVMIAIPHHLTSVVSTKGGKVEVLLRFGHVHILFTVATL